LKQLLASLILLDRFKNLLRGCIGLAVLFNLLSKSLPPVLVSYLFLKLLVCDYFKVILVAAVSHHIILINYLLILHTHYSGGYWLLLFINLVSLRRGLIVNIILQLKKNVVKVFNNGVHCVFLLRPSLPSNFQGLERIFYFFKEQLKIAVA
jgi:hypothetical protein